MVSPAGVVVGSLRLSSPFIMDFWSIFLTIVCQAAEWILATGSCIVLMTRIYTRFKIVGVGFQREDFFLVSSQFLFYGWISMDAFDISRGFMDDDRSYFDNLGQVIPGTPEQKQTVLQVVYTSAVPYYLSLWLVKFALLGLYYRLVPQKTKMRIFLNITTAVAIASTIVIILMNLFICVPVSLNWSLDPNNFCYSSTAVKPFIISVIMNIVVDVAIFIIPFPVIRAVKNGGTRRKIGLTITFSLGLITIIVIVIRAVLLALSGSVVETAVLTALECCISIIVACLPSLRPLFKIVSEKKRSSNSQKNDAEWGAGSLPGKTQYITNEPSEESGPFDTPTQESFESSFEMSQPKWNDKTPVTLATGSTPESVVIDTRRSKYKSDNHSDFSISSDERTLDHHSNVINSSSTRGAMSHEEELDRVIMSNYGGSNPLPSPPTNGNERFVPSYVLEEPLPNPVI